MLISQTIHTSRLSTQDKWNFNPDSTSVLQLSHILWYGRSYKEQKYVSQYVWKSLVCHIGMVCTRCVYCGINATGSDATGITQHRSCHDEWDRRVDEKLRVNCGRPLEQTDVDFDCKHHKQCPPAGSFPGYLYSQITVWFKPYSQCYWKHLVHFFCSVTSVSQFRHRTRTARNCLGLYLYCILVHAYRFFLRPAWMTQQVLHLHVIVQYGIVAFVPAHFESCAIFAQYFLNSTNWHTIRIRFL